MIFQGCTYISNFHPLELQVGENFKFPWRGLYNLYVVQYVFWRGLIHCTACRLVTRINCTILSYFVGVINCTTCHFAGTVIIVQHDLLRVIPVLFSNHLEYQGFNSLELLTNKLRSVWEFTVTVYIWSGFFWVLDILDWFYWLLFYVLFPASPIDPIKLLTCHLYVCYYRNVTFRAWSRFNSQIRKVNVTIWVRILVQVTTYCSLRIGWSPSLLYQNIIVIRLYVW